MHEAGTDLEIWHCAQKGQMETESSRQMDSRARIRVVALEKRRPRKLQKEVPIDSDNSSLD